MAKKSRNSCKFAAAILIIVNLIVMIFCLLLFGISLWMISSPTTLSAYIEFGGNTLKALLPPDVLSIQNGLAFAVISIFVFIISFMGLYGAINRSQFLLFMYSTLLILLLLLECSLMFYFSSNLTEKGIQESDGQWAHVLRISFHCCNFDRNITKELSPPWSCCGVNYYPSNCTVANFYKKDCQKTISDWLDKYQSTIYTSLAVVHIVLLSCSLMRRSCSASRSHT